MLNIITIKQCDFICGGYVKVPFVSMKNFSILSIVTEKAYQNVIYRMECDANTIECRYVSEF